MQSSNFADRGSGKVQLIDTNSSQRLFCNDIMEFHSERGEMMHIQVVTFTSHINRRDYENMVIEGAPVWAAVPGLIIKHFVYNFEEHKFGGIYLWEDEESMQEYCKSDLFKSVIEHPAFSDHESQIFEVHELGRIMQENK